MTAGWAIVAAGVYAAVLANAWRTRRRLDLGDAGDREARELRAAERVAPVPEPEPPGVELIPGQLYTLPSGEMARVLRIWPVADEVWYRTHGQASHEHWEIQGAVARRTFKPYTTSGPTPRAHGAEPQPAQGGPSGADPAPDPGDGS